ncbi:hypothetical protein K1719_020236 [Acacia pycnantha]|nr:hypothetical protein K1719_020236 [Acacia pycnantha]
MGETNAVDSTNVPSFKDKLLNADSNKPEDDDDELVLNTGDVSIGLNGTIPTVDFASHVIETLNKRMGLAVVVKLLGRKMGYRQLRNQLQNLWKPANQIKLIDLDEDCFLVRFQDDMDYQNALLSGPWVIFGHYLTVQPWTPSFKPHNHVINHVMGWIRLPKLPARYYHKSVIRSIGGVFGEVIRVDYNTDFGDRGKFARIAVSLDLTKPLISKIMVDGEIIYVEYEGLPTICFHCGRYRHLKEACPALKAPSSGNPSENPLVPEPNAPINVHQARESSEFGSWMQVQRRRRPPVRGDRPNEASGSKKVAGATRYEVLREVVEDEAPQVLDSAGGDSYPKVDTFVRKKKVNETKSSKKSGTGSKQKTSMPQEMNQECLFQSKHYTSKDATSSLDPKFNSAVQIEDSRLPRRSKEAQRVPSGPNGQLVSTNGNDPLSKSRGLKLSTSVTIHKLGGKPISVNEGPSAILLEEVAQDLQMDHDAPDVALQNEGVIPNPNFPS